MKKRTFTIMKWCVQVILASLLSYLTAEHLMGRGDTGTMIVGMLKTFPFAVTVGVVLGDISLYQGQKFSLLAVFVALLLGPVGVILSLIMADLSPFSGKLVPIFFLFGMVAMCLPSLIGYNFVAVKIRKRWPKRAGS